MTDHDWDFHASCCHAEPEGSTGNPTPTALTLVSEPQCRHEWLPVGDVRGQWMDRRHDGRLLVVCRHCAETRWVPVPPQDGPS